MWIRGMVRQGPQRACHRCGIFLSRGVLGDVAVLSAIKMFRACPCCGYQTIDPEPGSYDICPICFWEDDIVQNENPDMAGGANSVSLRQAQENYVAFGACSRKDAPHVRPPSDDDIRDPNWAPLPKRE